MRIKWGGVKRRVRVRRMRRRNRRVRRYRVRRRMRRSKWEGGSKIKCEKNKVKRGERGN